MLTVFCLVQQMIQDQQQHNRMNLLKPDHINQKNNCFVYGKSLPQMEQAFKNFIALFFRLFKINKPVEGTNKECSAYNVTQCNRNQVSSHKVAIIKNTQ